MQRVREEKDSRNQKAQHLRFYLKNEDSSRIHTQQATSLDIRQPKYRLR